MESGTEEYLVIEIHDGKKVMAVSPRNAQTESAKTERGEFDGLAAVLNKFAEYGYDMMPVVLPGPAPTFSTIIMKRKR